MEHQSNITDHEAILLLRQDVKAVKDGQDRFHIDMRDSINDLKNNYSGKLNDFEDRLNRTDDALNEVKLSTGKQWGWIGGLGGSIILICALISYIYIAHVDDTKESIKKIETTLQEHVNLTK
jgi:hypothetical protein